MNQTFQSKLTDSETSINYGVIEQGENHHPGDQSQYQQQGVSLTKKKSSSQQSNNSQLQVIYEREQAADERSSILMQNYDDWNSASQDDNHDALEQNPAHDYSTVHEIPRVHIVGGSNKHKEEHYEDLSSRNEVWAAGSMNQEGEPEKESSVQRSLTKSKSASSTRDDQQMPINFSTTRDNYQQIFMSSSVDTNQKRPSVSQYQQQEPNSIRTETSSQLYSSFPRESGTISSNSSSKRPSSVRPGSRISESRPGTAMLVATNTPNLLEVKWDKEADGHAAPSSGRNSSLFTRRATSSRRVKRANPTTSLAKKDTWER